MQTCKYLLRMWLRKKTVKLIFYQVTILNQNQVWVDAQKCSHISCSPDAEVAAVHIPGETQERINCRLLRLQRDVSLTI